MEDKVMLMMRSGTLFPGCPMTAKCIYVWNAADTLAQTAGSEFGDF
jgi:hypothetical protein